MHRSLVFLAAAFVTGITANNLIRLTPGYFIAGLAFLLCWHFYRWRLPGTAPAATFLLLAFLTGALGHSFAFFPAAHSVVHWANSSPGILSGTVVGRSAAGAEQSFLLVRSESITAGGAERKASGLVRVVPPDETAVCPGERIIISGKIELPAAAANPGEFDYRAYLLRHGIRAVMYPEDISQVSGVSPARPSPARLAYVWKNSLARINFLTLPPDYAALLSGMLYGSRENIPAALADRLRDAGVIHIITVSGLHVGFIVSLAVLMGRLLRLSGQAAGLLAGAVVASYVFVVGAAPPVLRAGVMAGAGFAGSLLGREKDRYTLFAAAVLVVLGLQPLNLFDVSFQLSFVTTFAIIHLTPFFAAHLTVFPKRARGFLGMALAAQLGITPLLLYYYYQATPAALPANLMIIPLAGAAVMLGLAAGFAGLFCLEAAAGLNAVNFIILRLIVGIAGFCSRLPYANLRLTPPSCLSMLIYYCFLFSLPYWRTVILVSRTRGARLCGAAGKAGVIICLALSAVFAWGPRPDRPVKVTFLAVGQGSAAFVRTGRASGVLIDGGNRFDGEDWQIDLGDRVIEPFLRRQGISHLDIIYTHGHDDHIGGLVTVAERFRVGTLYGPPAAGDSPLYRQLHELCRTKNIPFRILTAGDTLALENGAEILVLHPKGEDRTENLNEASLVLQLRAGELTVLFTGDSGPAAFRRLLAADAAIASDILIVPHHGSRTAYAPELYQAVSPQYAVIPVGKNSFGHPAAQVVYGLQAMEIGVCRTDWTGAVTVTQQGKGFRLETFLPAGIAHGEDRDKTSEY